MARIFFGLVLSLWLALAVPVHAGGSTALDRLETKLEQQFSTVKNLEAEQFEKLAGRAPDNVILLDVREPREFAVSHITGAERVSPAIDADNFASQFSDKVKGKTVILYCSVGYRSSQLAERTQKALMQAGAGGVYNLRGGIFAWHNAKRPLVRSKAATDFVHPYNTWWGGYLQRREKTRYRPE